MPSSEHKTQQLSEGVLITQLYDSSEYTENYDDSSRSSSSSSFLSDVGLYGAHYQLEDDNVDYDTDLDIQDGEWNT